MIVQDLFEAPQSCPECGGISFSDLILAEKKDACYYKVKASAKVWPSAYASGRLVQCRKKGAANWGNKSEGVAEDAALAEEFDLIENIINNLADYNNVDAEVIWEDLESLTDDELYVFAVTTPIMEDWQKVNKRDRTDGMSRKAVNAYRRENPGSKLKTAVTTKPSKLKRGSKASKRRSSYCSRSRGQMKMHSISCAKTPDKAICKARRRWNCESVDLEQGVAEGLDPAKKGRLYDLIELYRDATEPNDYYDRDIDDPDEVIAMIRSEFGDKIAGQVAAGAEKMHYPRHGIQRSDPLGGNRPVDRITKAGKMYKQDMDFRKRMSKYRMGIDEQGVAEGSDDDIWGPRGNFAGDKHVDIGGVTMKIIQVGDTVKYLGQQAKVVGMSKDRKYSRISIGSGFGGSVKDVLTADLKQLGQGVAEGDTGDTPIESMTAQELAAYLNVPVTQVTQDLAAAREMARDQAKDMVGEGMADDMLKIAQKISPEARLRGTPEQERERTRQAMAQRDQDRRSREQAEIEADRERLPELEAQYQEMQQLYDQLGGSGWQYADSEQNLSSSERRARAMEPQMQQLAIRIQRATQAPNVTESIHSLRRLAGLGQK